jgi:outer membrane protein assembly factor BamE (lipoprotein component of BamABCDE complex)
MRLDSIFSFLLIGSLLTSCVSPQSSLDRATVNQIKEGVSRRAEVEKLLGKARTTTVGANRNTATQYYSRQQMGPGASLQAGGATAPSDIRFRALSLVYGPDQVVKKTLFDETVIRCQPTAQGFTTGRFVSQDELARLEKGKSTRDELVARFGPPTIRILNTEGNVVLNWIYTSTEGQSGGPRRKQTFWAVIDDKGVAQNFGITGDVP